MEALVSPSAAQASGGLSAKSSRILDNSASVGAGAAKSAVQKAAEEFETTFLNQMLGTMFEGISTEAPFGGGYGEKVFRSMMVSEYAKDIVRSGGIGISDAVAQELLAQQEGRNK